MSEFVQCIGCGATIHKTATTCPKCGAPQIIAEPAQSVPVGIAASTVPWFRKRWFVLLCLVTITPIASLLAMTGNIHYTGRNGTPTVFPKPVRNGLMIATLPWMIVTFGGESSSVVLAAVGLLVFAVLLAFKK